MTAANEGAWTPGPVTQADKDMAERFIAPSDGDFPMLADLFARHREAAQADLAEALEAWVAAQQATDDAVEHLERAAAEGWLYDPTGSGWVAQSDRVADAAWDRAHQLRDAALAKARGETGGEK